jgi:putative transposase
MTPITWDALNWAIIKASLSKELKVILVAGDATTVTKSGKETYGLGRFFSSIYSRAVPGIAFQTLSLIDVSQRKSWALLMEQILPKAKQQKSKKQTVKAKRGKGRPKGSKNKNHRNVKLNAEMMQVKAMLKKLLKRTKDTLLLVYFVYDGAFGNNAAVQMTRQVGLHLISKLRNDSALYFK